MMNVMNLRPTLEVDRHDLLRLVRPRSLDSRPLISLRGVSRLYDGGAITALQNVSRAVFRAIIRKPSCLISCSHWAPDGSCVVLVGKHGAMNPAGRVRCNMRAK
jgi:hypothetical protein